MKILNFVVCLLAVLLSEANAQNYQVGLGVGKAIYWGDLNAESFNSNLRNNDGFAFQVFIRKHINNYFAVKGNLLFSKVKGSDIFAETLDRRMRNLSFRSVINEGSVALEVYPFKFNPYDEETVFSPYGTIGLGAFYFNPTAVYNGNTIELQPLGTEGQGMPGFKNKYNRLAASLTFGGGLAFKVSDRIIINADVIGRRSTTDYIDDVSGTYVNYNELRAGNGILAAELADRTNEFNGQSEPLLRETGSQRGGKLVKDYYFTGMLSVAFTFGDNNSNRFNNNRGRGNKLGRKSGVQCPRF